MKNNNRHTFFGITIPTAFCCSILILGGTLFVRNADALVILPFVGTSIGGAACPSTSLDHDVALSQASVTVGMGQSTSVIEKVNGYYMISNSSPDIAFVSASGTQITVVGIAPGTDLITVGVTGASGPSYCSSLTVTVPIPGSSDNSVLGMSQVSPNEIENMSPTEGIDSLLQLIQSLTQKVNALELQMTQLQQEVATTTLGDVGKIDATSTSNTHAAPTTGWSLIKHDPNRVPTSNS